MFSSIFHLAERLQRLSKNSRVSASVPSSQSSALGNEDDARGQKEGLP